MPGLPERRVPDQDTGREDALPEDPGDLSVLSSDNVRICINLRIIEFSTMAAKTHRTRPLGVTIIGVLLLLYGLFMLLSGISFGSLDDLDDLELAVRMVSLVMGLVYLLLAFGFFKGWGWVWLLTMIVVIIGHNMEHRFLGHWRIAHGRIVGAVHRADHPDHHRALHEHHQREGLLRQALKPFPVFLFRPS